MTSRKMLVLGAVLCGVASLANAAIYTANLGNLVIPNPGPLNVPFNIPGSDTSPVRGFLIGGNWTAGPGNPFSNEFRAGMDGSTRVSQGGAANGSPFAFPVAAATTYNNSSWANDLYGANSLPVSGNHTAAFHQTFAGSSANLNNATAILYTDALPPITSSIVAGPTFNRPTSLTALSGVGTAVYYNVHPFVGPATGDFMLEMSTPTGVPDSYLLIYNGSFNPASPLTNLIGLDDDSSAGVGFSSGIYMKLNAGQNYVAVATTFDNGEVGAYSLYIAGAPEPATICLLMLGGMAVLRRRS